MTGTNNKKPPTQWAKGQSGNPRGKPAGSGAVQKLRAALEGDIPEILAALAAQAKAGDVGAARLILDRVLPPLKAVEQPVEL